MSHAKVVDGVDELCNLAVAESAFGLGLETYIF